MLLMMMMMIMTRCIVVRSRDFDDPDDGDDGDVDVDGDYDGDADWTDWLLKCIIASFLEVPHELLAVLSLSLSAAIVGDRLRGKITLQSSHYYTE